MSKPERLPSVVNDQTYFITTGTDGRERLFIYPAFANLFIDTLYSYRGDAKYQIHAFVLMPEHFHALLTPARGITIERAVQFIKGGYSFRVNNELRRSFEIWQPGFTDRRVRVGEYEGFQTYIDQNPVKAGLAKSPEEYPYGSASGKYELDVPPSWLLTSAAKAAG
jgi:putative transposase